jgi:hypothetical protein
MGNFFSNFLSGDRRWLKILILVLVVVIVIFIALTIIFVVADGNKGSVPPDNPADVVNSFFGQSNNLAVVSYNPELTFDKYGKVKMADGKKLTPIENNLFKAGKGKKGTDLHYDSEIVKRVIFFNSDWVKQQNEAKKTVEKSLKKGSAAVKKLAEKGLVDGAESQVAFHSLQIGATTKGSGKTYYIITKEVYTLAVPNEGITEPREFVYVYKLVPQGDEMVIEDYEVLS